MKQELIKKQRKAKFLVAAGRLIEAESLLRTVVHEAEKQRDFWIEWVAVGDLMRLLMRTGRSEEAMGLMASKKRCTRHGQLGPWAELDDAAYELHLLNHCGRYNEVLSRLVRLRSRLNGLPEPVDILLAPVDPWEVRESILQAGYIAAVRLKRWSEALVLNSEIVGSLTARGASKPEIMSERFNASAPLLGLKRHAEARALLLECRKVFEATGQVDSMARTFSALANLEDTLGRPQQAIAHEQTALRYHYLGCDPVDCGNSHFNLANSLMQVGAPQVAMAHRLVAMLIFFQVGSGHFEAYVDELWGHLAASVRSGSHLPGFDEIRGIVEQVEGVHFRELFGGLPTTGTASAEDILLMCCKEP